MVRGIPFSNSRILLELSRYLCSYEQVTTYERVFTNRFGKCIKEDILILKKVNHSPVTGNARQMAIDHLEKALDIAKDDIAEDVQDALSQTNTICPSPLFSKKGII